MDRKKRAQAVDARTRGIRVAAARRVVVGLGANLGDRGLTIERAAHSLGERLGFTLVACSPLYETPPAGGPPQPDYWNGAALVLTSLPARDILSVTLAIERSLGRVRPDPVRWGPRTIDLDILWIEGEEIAEPDLEVPHPRLEGRVFALRPLLDVAPDAAHPRTSQRYADLPAARLPITRVGPGDVG
jgi:2-amino-4-hydroxy-6-hydroxymethyldihydropteridine diphosphokinase